MSTYTKEESNKPKIDELFEAIKQFSLDNMRAGINKQRFKESRERFRGKLTQMGIDDAFDWTED